MTLSDPTSTISARRRAPLLGSVALSALLSSGLALAPRAADAAVPTGDALANLTVEQILAGYASGDYTPLQLTQSYLDRIAQWEPVYNAFVTMNPNVLADAAALTAPVTPALLASKPLYGVPIGIKESMDVAGLRTTAGSSYFGKTTDGSWLNTPVGSVAPGAVEMIPGTDSTITARLRAAGAIIVGKTSINDFALTGNNATSSLNGQVGNAYDPRRTPGGSSGGSGTAVGAGFVAIATAEETGSSITNPASAASIVGMKPTFGTVPSTGVFPLAGYFRDNDGSFGKTVRDAARMLDVMAGPSHTDPKPSPAAGNIPPGGFVKYINDHPNALKNKRIAALNLDGLGFGTVNVTDAQTRTLFAKELDAIRASGAEIVDDPFVGTQWRTLITNTPASNTFSWDVQDYLKRLGPDAAFNSTQEYDALFSAASGKKFYEIPGMPGATMVAGVYNEEDPAMRADLDAYRLRRSQLQGFYEFILDEFNLDAIVLPQLAAPVGSLFDANGGRISRTPPGALNVMGAPGIVLPGGYYADGSPFATYFVGRLNDDAELYALGADYEADTLHRIAPIMQVPEPVSLAALGMVSLIVLRRTRSVA